MEITDSFYVDGIRYVRYKHREKVVVEIINVMYKKECQFLPFGTNKPSEVRE